VTLTSKLNLHEKALTHCIAAIKLNSKMHKGILLNCALLFYIVYLITVLFHVAYHLMGNIMQNLGRDAHAEKYFRMAEELARENQDFIPEAGLPSASAPRSFLESLPVFSLKMGEIHSVTVRDVKMEYECLSERPLIINVKNFATSDECNHITARAEPSLQRSFVMGATSTSSDMSTQTASYRNSLNTWLSVDEVLVRIQERIGAVTGIPPRYIAQKSEEIQVVKYDTGGSSFRIHHDSSNFQPRLLTALLYLSGPPITNFPGNNNAHKNTMQGSSTAGETWFPFTGSADRLFDQYAPTMEISILNAQSAEEMLDQSTCNNNGRDNLASSCLEVKEKGDGLFVSPAVGNAIIFFNHLSSGVIDTAAIHAGLPTSSDSAKWIANYWVQYDSSLLNSFA
jgi:hypothetical protein